MRSRKPRPPRRSRAIANPEDFNPNVKADARRLQDQLRSRLGTIQSRELAAQRSKEAENEPRRVIKTQFATNVNQLTEKSLVIFLVNPTQLRWAASAYTAVEQAKLYADRKELFIDAIKNLALMYDDQTNGDTWSLATKGKDIRSVSDREWFNFIVRLRTREPGESETLLTRWTGNTVRNHPRFDEDTEYDLHTVAAQFSWLDQHYGLESEAQAIMLGEDGNELSFFGILDTTLCDDKNFTLNGAAVSQAQMHAFVQRFGAAVNAGIPMLSDEDFRYGRAHVLFVASGAADALEGMGLYPLSEASLKAAAKMASRKAKPVSVSVKAGETRIGKYRKKEVTFIERAVLPWGDKAIEAIASEVVNKGLWGKKAQNWANGASIYFALPHEAWNEAKPVPSELTLTPELIQYIAPKISEEPVEQPKDQIDVLEVSWIEPSAEWTPAALGWRRKLKTNFLIVDPDKIWLNPALFTALARTHSYLTESHVQDVIETTAKDLFPDLKFRRLDPSSSMNADLGLKGLFSTPRLVSQDQEALIKALKKQFSHPGRVVSPSTANLEVHITGMPELNNLWRGKGSLKDGQFSAQTSVSDVKFPPKKSVVAAPIQFPKSVTQGEAVYGFGPASDWTPIKSFDDAVQVASHVAAGVQEGEVKEASFYVGVLMDDKVIPVRLTVSVRPSDVRVEDFATKRHNEYSKDEQQETVKVRKPEHRNIHRVRRLKPPVLGQITTAPIALDTPVRKEHKYRILGRVVEHAHHRADDGKLIKSVAGHTPFLDSVTFILLDVKEDPTQHVGLMPGMLLLNLIGFTQVPGVQTNKFKFLVYEKEGKKIELWAPKKWSLDDGKNRTMVDGVKESFYFSTPKSETEKFASFLKDKGIERFKAHIISAQAPQAEVVAPSVSFSLDLKEALTGHPVFDAKNPETEEEDQSDESIAQPQGALLSGLRQNLSMKGLTIGFFGTTPGNGVPRFSDTVPYYGERYLERSIAAERLTQRQLFTSRYRTSHYQMADFDGRIVTTSKDSIPLTLAKIKEDRVESKGSYPGASFGPAVRVVNDPEVVQKVTELDALLRGRRLEMAEDDKEAKKGIRRVWKIRPEKRSAPTLIKFTDIEEVTFTIWGVMDEFAYKESKLFEGRKPLFNPGIRDEDYKAVFDSLKERNLSESENYPVNVWFGNKSNVGQNRHLSNLAPRQFKFQWGSEGEQTYMSVEHAFQTLKNNRFDAETYARGEDFVEGRKNAPPRYDKSITLELMYQLIKASMLQNPQILKSLLETYPRRIEHKGPGAKDDFWQKHFPEILMQVRDEILEEFKGSEAKTNGRKARFNPDSPESMVQDDLDGYLSEDFDEEMHSEKLDFAQYDVFWQQTLTGRQLLEALAPFKKVPIDFTTIQEGVDLSEGNLDRVREGRQSLVLLSSNAFQDRAQPAAFRNLQPGDVCFDSANEIFYRYRGLLNLPDLMTQFYDESGEESAAQQSLLSALGASGLDSIDEISRIDMMEENPDLIDFCNETEMPVHVFDAVPGEEDEVPTFSYVEGVPTPRFSAYNAIRFWAAYNSGLYNYAVAALEQPAEEEDAPKRKGRGGRKARQLVKDTPVPFMMVVTGLTRGRNRNWDSLDRQYYGSNATPLEHRSVSGGFVSVVDIPTGATAIGKSIPTNSPDPYELASIFSVRRPLDGFLWSDWGKSVTPKGWTSQVVARHIGALDFIDNMKKQRQGPQNPFSFMSMKETDDYARTFWSICAQLQNQQDSEDITDQPDVKVIREFLASPAGIRWKVLLESKGTVQYDSAIRSLAKQTGTDPKIIADVLSGKYASVLDDDQKVRAAAASAYHAVLRNALAKRQPPGTPEQILAARQAYAADPRGKSRFITNMALSDGTYTQRVSPGDAEYGTDRLVTEVGIAQKIRTWMRQEGLLDKGHRLQMPSAVADVAVEYEARSMAALQRSAEDVLDNFIMSMRDEDFSPFQQAYFDRIAKANPKFESKYGRSARSGRHSRANPFDPKAPEVLDPLVKIARGAIGPEGLIGRPSDADVEKARDALAKLQGIEAYPDWRVTKGDMETYFPTGGGSTHRDVKDRLTAGLTSKDLVSQVLSRDPGQFKRDRDPLVLDEDLKSLLPRQLGLSVQDAARILYQQKEKFAERKKDTLTPSAALCKTYRSKRLEYELQPVTFNAVNKGILIWLSPKDSEIQRVMTFRRGDHIDCDLTSYRWPEEDITSLMNRAIQASLFWLAEKKKRRLNTTIYLGRVGDPKLTVIYKPGWAISIQTVLTLFAQGETVDAYGDLSKQQGPRAQERDLKEYRDAEMKWKSREESILSSREDAWLGSQVITPPPYEAPVPPPPSPVPPPAPAPAKKTETTSTEPGSLQGFLEEMLSKSEALASKVEESPSFIYDDGSKSWTPSNEGERLLLKMIKSLSRKQVGEFVHGLPQSLWPSRLFYPVTPEDIVKFISKIVPAPAKNNPSPRNYRSSRPQRPPRRSRYAFDE